MEEAEEAGTREVVRRVQGRVLDPRETTTTTSELLATVATEEGEQVDVSLGSTSIARTDSTSGRNDEIQVWISYDSGGTGIDRKTTILRMMPSETIADVKLRVQARKGWFAPRRAPCQKLAARWSNCRRPQKLCKFPTTAAPAAPADAAHPYLPRKRSCMGTTCGRRRPDAEPAPTHATPGKLGTS